MKLVCINNVELGRDSRGNPRHKTLPLTIGKIYEVDDKLVVDSSNPIKELSKLVFILSDDNDENRFYTSSNFVTLDIWREMQLNKLI
jgi:hypothetical protein